MRLSSLNASNFQSFGSAMEEISFEDVTYLLGPNGAGKTAVLQALCRMFSVDPSLRRIRRSDFHVPAKEAKQPEQRRLWLEADFTFDETLDDDDNDTVPSFFGQNHAIVMPDADMATRSINCWVLSSAPPASVAWRCP